MRFLKIYLALLTDWLYRILGKWDDLIAQTLSLTVGNRKSKLNFEIRADNSTLLTCIERDRGIDVDKIEDCKEICENPEKNSFSTTHDIVTVH